MGRCWACCRKAGTVRPRRGSWPWRAWCSCCSFSSTSSSALVIRPRRGRSTTRLIPGCLSGPAPRAGMQSGCTSYRSSTRQGRWPQLRHSWACARSPHCCSLHCCTLGDTCSISRTAQRSTTGLCFGCRCYSSLRSRLALTRWHSARGCGGAQQAAPCRGRAGQRSTRSRSPPFFWSSPRHI